MASESPKFKYLPLASDHDLTSAHVHARAVIGHGIEPWLVRALSDWLTAAEAELRRRGLLKDANRVERLMWKDHHERNAAAAKPTKREDQHPLTVDALRGPRTAPPHQGTRGTRGADHRKIGHAQPPRTREQALSGQTPG